MRYQYLARTGLLILLVLCGTGTASATQVGVYPGTDYLGTIERGETASIDMLLVGGEAGTEVGMNARSVHRRDIRDRDRPYPFAPQNASQEDVTGWVEILADRVTLEKPRGMYKDGRRVTANAKMSYLLHVPDDAEPGYHVGVLRPRILSIPSAGGDIGVSAQAIAQYKFVFYVPGKAVRDIKILGFNSNPTAANRDRIEIVVRNTGTVTTTVRVTPTLHLPYGPRTLPMRGGTLAPGEITTLRTHATNNLTNGTYNIEADADWITGSTTENGTVTFTAYQPTVTARIPVNPTDTTVLETVLSILAIILSIAVVREAWKRKQS